ncbi:O-antigen polymerase [Macrococcoides canis]|uniref:O-antigen polymerase n=1 Tax=Macrococcoides canis TaxID=1855823 RepID=UPI00165D7824|nr:O-antigen polymerase [Macrococcus canis]QNR07502.1 oligosaccharide repeat unit polymerase [Macrococcus canis]
MLLINLLLLLLLFLILFVEVNRINRLKIDGLTFFNFWFLIVFVLVPFLILNFGSNFAHPTFYYLSLKGNIVIVLTIIIFYFSMIFAYYLTPNTNVILKTSSNKNKYILFTILLTVLAIIGAYIFIDSYGGLSNLVSNVNTIRNGTLERNTFGAFFGLFGNYIVILFWSYLLYLINKRKFNFKIIFLFGLSIYWLFLRGSRGSFIDLFLISYAIIVLKTQRYHIKLLALIVPISIFILLYGKSIFVSLDLGYQGIFDLIKDLNQNTTFLESIQSVIHNFAHPFMSLNLSFDKVETLKDYRYFKDIPNAFIFYLQLIGFERPDTITYLNTEYVIGRYESNIPPGIIAFGYYSLGVFGVLLTGAILGIFIKFIDSIYKNSKPSNEDKFLTVIYLIFISSIGQFIIVGDIRVTIIQEFHNIILILLYLMIFCKFYKKRVDV